MKYMPENILALCRVCHRWMHDNPIKAKKWQKQAIPCEIQGFLRDTSRSVGKIHFYFEEEKKKLNK